MPAARKLQPLNPRDRVAARMCALVNQHFDGNLSAAAEAIDCDYDALARACQGTRRGPGVPLLKKMSLYFDTKIEELIA